MIFIYVILGKKYDRIYYLCKMQEAGLSLTEKSEESPGNAERHAS